MASNSTAVLDIWSIPFLAPPPGVVSNFINPESRGPLVRAGMYTILAIMMVFVLMRIYNRLYILRAFGVDDYLCLLSTAAIIAFSGLVLSFMDNPEGRHGWDIPYGEVLTNHYWLEATLGSILVYTLGNLFTKLTLLTLYLRIFRPAVWARMAIYAGIFVSTVFYIGTFIGYLSLCTHAGSPVWTTMTQLRCANHTLEISKAQGWYGLISDVYIFAIPLALLGRLNLDLRRKLGVMAVFAVGLVAIAIASVSLEKRYEAVEQGADRTWINSIIFLYTTLELAIGLICSCMPVIGMTIKNSVTTLNSLWISLRTYGTNIVSRTSRQGSLGNPSKEQLPNNADDNVSAPRSFIQRFRRNNENTVKPTEPITLGTFNSVDYIYHEQLRQMNSHKSNV